MRLRHLKTFEAVAATLNVTRAAQRLHLAQSSVTEQIQTLEADLGAALFDRAGGRLALTPAGARLVSYADEILDLVDEARSAVAGAAEVEGALSIGGLETLCARRLPKLLARFQASHPAVSVKLSAGGTGTLRRDVAESVLDVCATFGPPPEDPRLRSVAIGREPLVVVAPPNHRLAGRTPTRQALAGEGFLVTEPGCAYRAMFDAAFPPEGRPRLVGEYGSLGAIRALVASGAGLALMPRLAAEGDGAPVAVLPWPDVQDVAVVLTWRRRRVLPSALRAFLDAASDQSMAAVDV